MSRSFVIDRVFRGVGRIKRSSGTSHARTFRRINEMLTTLFERGRLDLLIAIRDGLLTPLQVYHAFNASKLDLLPAADDLANLHETMLAWAEGYTCSDRHRESLKQSVRYLAPQGSTYPVGSLVARLEALKTRMKAKDQGRTFNLARSAAQSFARDTRKKHSQLWRDISGIENLTVHPKRKPHPMDPKELVELVLRLPSGVREDAWSMVHCGMRPAEYWGTWSAQPDRILVTSAKQRVRSGKPPVVRAVPRVIMGEIKPPRSTYKAMQKAFKKITDGVVEPYDLRRSFANWMEAARIHRTNRKGYLGHGAKDVTDRYEWHEMDAFLDADARLLRDYLVNAIIGTRITVPPNPKREPTEAGLPRFVTPLINAPSRNRTENLLIKRQMVGHLENEEDAR